MCRSVLPATPDWPKCRPSPGHQSRWDQGRQLIRETTVRTIALFSALAIGAMTSAALAASTNSRDTTTYLGSSDNECTSNCDVPGRTTTSSNKGNPDNTKCNDCGTTGPGNK